MELTAVDQLLAFLVADQRTAHSRMLAAGYSDDQIRDAWDQARKAGYTEPTGLGQDRLTASGRSRGEMILQQTTEPP